MSNKAITWAYQQDLKAGPKFVLVTLADMADQDHSCYPGIPELARLTGYGATAVSTSIEALAEGHYVIRERRARKDGSRTSNRYYLDPEATLGLRHQKPESEASPKAGIRGAQKPESGEPNTGIRGAILEPTVNPKNEPKELNAQTGKNEQLIRGAQATLVIFDEAVLATPEHPWATDAATAGFYDDTFEQLWKIWPRKDAKKTAKAKFKIAARKRGARQLVEDAKAWLAARPNVDANHVPYAATWLNQERWTDEPPAARPAAPPGRLPAVQAGLNLVEHFARLENAHEPHADRAALGPGNNLRQGDAYRG